MDTCVGNLDVYGKAIEIGSPQVMSYRNMLVRTAKVMGKKRLVFSVPVFSLGLSKLWVGLFGDSPPQLVSPLVESLKHTLTVSPELSFKEKEIDYLNYEDAVNEALNSKEDPNLPIFYKKKGVRNTVRSIQRMRNQNGNSATWIASRYNLWLPSFFKFMINGKMNENGDIGFHLMNGKNPMLQLTMIPDRSDIDRQLFYITGGWLVQRFDYGWLEFRGVLDNRYMISAIHEFVPRLPWFIYVNTQARMHLWVMNRFSSYLRRRHD
jgi:hypothetical protein